MEELSFARNKETNCNRNTKNLDGYTCWQVGKFKGCGVCPFQNGNVHVDFQCYGSLVGAEDL